MGVKQAFFYAMHHPSQEVARRLPSLWRLRAALYWDNLDYAARQRLMRKIDYRHRIYLLPYVATDRQALQLLFSGTSVIERALAAPLLVDIPLALDLLRLSQDDAFFEPVDWRKARKTARPLFEIFPPDYYEKIAALPPTIQRILWRLAAGGEAGIKMAPYLVAVRLSEAAEILQEDPNNDLWIVFRTLLRLAQTRVHPFVLFDSLRNPNLKALLHFCMERGIDEKTIVEVMGEEGHAFPLALERGAIDEAVWRALPPERIAAALMPKPFIARHCATEMLKAHPESGELRRLVDVATKRRTTWAEMRDGDAGAEPRDLMTLTYRALANALPDDGAQRDLKRLAHPTPGAAKLLETLAEIPFMRKEEMETMRLLLLTDSENERRLLEALCETKAPAGRAFDLVSLAILFKRHPDSFCLWKTAMSSVNIALLRFAEQRRALTFFATAPVPESWWEEEQARVLKVIAPDIHDRALHTCPPERFIRWARPLGFFHLLGSYVAADETLVAEHTHILPFAFQNMRPESSSRWIGAIVMGGLRPEESRWRLLPHEIKYRLMTSFPVLFSLRPRLMARLEMDKAAQELLDRLRR